MRPSRARHVVVGWTLAVAAIAYLDRICISTAAPAIRAEFGLSDAEMGLVFSAFTLAYALFEIPSGRFADRFGPRLTLARIVVWWSALTAATGLARGFLSLLVLRFLFGLGEAGMFPATARAFACWLPAAERGRAFGLAIMTGALGGALSQPLVVALLGHTTWRVAFMLFGAVGLVWAIGWWWWFRDDPADHSAVDEAELRLIVAGRGPLPHAETVPWRLFLRHRTLLALCLMYVAAIYGWYFYLTWLPTYLLRARGFDLANVGMLAALPLVAIAAGVFTGGWASDRLSQRLGARRGRRITGLIGFPLAAAAIVAAVLTPRPIASAWLLAAAAGLAALGIAPAWAVAVQIGGSHAGVVTGAMNMCGNLGGALSPIVVGVSLSRLGSWEAPLFTMAAMYLVAAAAWWAIDAEERPWLDAPAEPASRAAS
ncbi:MAG TPA: MFS transporter [Candidatus Binatia bacterium]|nr:MFS transporter [Candidatus Binatia bacterium]